MALERCSPTAHEVTSILSTCSTDPADFTAFTVPSDCDLLVITFGCYGGATGIDVTAVTWDQGGAGQAMTQAVNAVDGNGDEVFQFYVYNPTTGNQTLRIDWGTSGPNEPTHISANYLVGAASTGIVVATDTIGTGTTHALSATGAVDDLALGVAYSYDTDPGVTAGTAIAGGALTGSGTCSDSNFWDTAYDDAGTAFAITFNNMDTAGYACSALAVYKASSGNITLTADAGAYTLTGTAAGTLQAHVITAESGSYTLTGTAAGTVQAHITTAEAGSYTLTGTAANTEQAHIITADAGSYALTGSDAGTVYASGETVIAETGAYALTGSDAGTLWDQIITAEVGSYTLTGFDATTTEAGPDPATQIDGDTSLVIAANYGGSTMYCSPANGWFTI